MILAQRHRLRSGEAGTDQGRWEATARRKEAHCHPSHGQRPGLQMVQLSRAEGKASDKAGKASRQWPLWGPGHVTMCFTSPLRNARSRFDCLWTADRGVEKKKARGVTLGFQGCQPAGT